MERCGAGRSPVHATPAHGFFASSKPSFFLIDGLYMVADDMPAHLRGQTIQVWLDGDLMMMAQD